MTAPTRRASLRQLADAAIPGPDGWPRTEELLQDGLGAWLPFHEHAAYIAALDPTTVRQLLNIADHAERVLRTPGTDTFTPESDMAWSDLSRALAAFEEAHRE